MSRRGSLRVGLQAVTKTLQIVIRCEEDQGFVFIAGEESQSKPLPVFLHRHSGHANAQNERRIDKLRPATALLLGDRGVELSTKLAAMSPNVALRSSTSAAMLPAFKTLGKPQKLEVVVAWHAGSVFEMLQACGTRSPSNLISDGMTKVRFVHLFAALDHGGDRKSVV